MWVELKANGAARNWGGEQTPGSEWFPDDTEIGPADELGRRARHGPPRVLGPDYQAPDWPARAARRWTGKTWESTGGQTGETDIEKVIRLLDANPVQELPDNPTTAQVVAQVRLHQRYIEGYRKILLRLLKFIIRRMGREFFRG